MWIRGLRIWWCQHAMGAVKKEKKKKKGLVKQPHSMPHPLFGLLVSQAHAILFLVLTLL